MLRNFENLADLNDYFKEKIVKPDYKITDLSQTLKPIVRNIGDEIEEKTGIRNDVHEYLCPFDSVVYQLEKSKDNKDLFEKVDNIRQSDHPWILDSRLRYALFLEDVSLPFDENLLFYVSLPFGYGELTSIQEIMGDVRDDISIEDPISPENISSLGNALERCLYKLE